MKDKPQSHNKPTPRRCGQTLYGKGGFKAKCSQPYGVEHSHHDLTAEEAVQAGKAVRS